MKPKQRKKLAVYAVGIVLIIALIWLIVALAMHTPNAADPTGSFSKNTAFPFEDDNLELDVESDPNVDGERDSVSDSTQSTAPDGEKEPNTGGNDPTEDTKQPDTDGTDQEEEDSVISGDDADAYIDADTFFG